MASGELDNPDASGGRELSPAASTDARAHPENTRAAAGRGQRADTARRAPAETLTRQEYSDAMRAQGPSAPSRDSTGDDALATTRCDAPASDRAGRDHDRDAAEPRDRASYATDMRASAADPLSDNGPSREGHDGGRAQGSPPDVPPPDRGQPAEPRGRDEYAEAVRAHPAADSGQSQAFLADSGNHTGPDDHLAPELETGHSLQDRPLYQQGPEDTSPQDAIPAADVPQTSTSAGELNGQGAPADTGEQPQDLDSADEVSSGHQKAYLEDHEVDVTHQPADGIWVSGLPGEIPGTPYGDPYGTAKIGEVMTGDEPSRSRADQVFSLFCERGDDLVDIAEKGLNEMQHILGPRPPTFTEAPVQLNHAAPETPHHEIDAGSMATALMALGVACWGLYRTWERRHETPASPEKGT